MSFTRFLLFSCAAEFDAVGLQSDLDLIKKATCSGVDLQNNKQYLVMGSSGSEVTNGGSIKSVSLHLSLTLSCSCVC